MRFGFAGLALISLVGCSDPPSEDEDGGGGIGGAGGEAGAAGVGGEAGAAGVGGEAGAAGGGGVGGAQPVDIAPGPPETAPPAGLDADPDIDPTRGECDARFAWVAGMLGWIIDDTGAPLAAAKAQACLYTEPGNVLLCLMPSDSAADGLFTVPVPDEARCNSGINMRVLLPGSGRASMYCAADNAEAIARVREPLVLYQTDPATSLGADLPFETPRDVVFPDGTTLKGFVPNDYFGSDFEQLGMKRVAPDARGLCFLEGRPAPAAVVAFYPEGALDQPLDIRLPNDLGLAAGSKVILTVLGSLDCTLVGGDHVQEADWFDYGTGTVTADGTAIENDPGSGVPCINWLGYRPM